MTKDIQNFGWELIELFATSDRLMCDDNPWYQVSFKPTLRDMGAANRGGWGVFGLHGEFDSTAEWYVPHWHAIVKGDLAELCSRPVTRRKYLPMTHRLALPGAIKQPIRKVRISPENRSALTYVAQPLWPDRPTGKWDEEFARRVRDKTHIDGPQHSEVLLWMDRWDFPDFFLLMGLCATSEGLMHTSNYPR